VPTRSFPRLAHGPVLHATLSQAGCPPGSTSVAAGDLTQSVLNSAGNGATLCLGDGVHRLSSSIAPLTNQRLVAQHSRLAVVSGTVLYTSGDFTLSGGLWFIGGQTQAGTRYTTGSGIGDELGYPEQVFYDDIPLLQVANKIDLSAGEFWFDYTNNEIWVFDNPSGHKIEIGAGSENAFDTTNDGVILEGLVIEKFNTPAGGSTACPLGADWRGSDLEVRLNYGGGTFAGDNSILEFSEVHDNRYIGTMGQGVDALLDTVEVYNNAWGSFNTNWESSGSKFVHTLRLTLNNCNYHDNRGAGFWTDIDNVYVTISGGTYSSNGRTDVIYGVSPYGNSGYGIVLEISFDTLVQNVIAEDNNGPGITSANTRGVTVTGCTARNNGATIGAGPGNIFALSANRGNSGATSGGPPYQQAIAALYGDNPLRCVRDYYVHDNTIGLCNGTLNVCGIESLSGDPSDPAVFQSTFNNRWEGNDYEFADSLTRYEWQDVSRTGVQWASGTFTWQAMDATGSWTP